MSLPITTGIFDTDTSSYVAPNTGTWANVTTWDGWSNWVNQPASYFTVVSEAQDRGSMGYFNLHTDTDVTGNISYQVYTSTTPDFAAGNVTISNISPGTDNISAFYGRYYSVVANVQTNGGYPALRSMTITSTDERLELTLNDIDSSTLSGNIAARTLPISRTISRVVSCQLTAHDVGNAVVATDTSNYYMETRIFPAPVGYIVSKSASNPTVCFREVANGSLVNATFDATLKVLPEQYMDTTNLGIR